MERTAILAFKNTVAMWTPSYGAIWWHRNNEHFAVAVVMWTSFNLELFLNSRFHFRSLWIDPNL